MFMCVDDASCYFVVSLNICVGRPIRKAQTNCIGHKLGDQAITFRLSYGKESPVHIEVFYCVE